MGFVPVARSNLITKTYAMVWTFILYVNGGHIHLDI